MRKSKGHRTNVLKAVRDDPEGEEAKAFYSYMRQVNEHPGGHMGFLVEQNAKRARTGDTEAARLILDDFLGTVTQRSEGTWDGPIWYEYASYLANAFEKILAGTDPAVALGIKSSRPGRRPSKLTDTMREALAAGYELLRRKGLTKKQAMDGLEAAGYSRSTIHRARRDHQWMDSQSVEMVKVIAKPVASKIAMILDAKRTRRR